MKTKKLSKVLSIVMAFVLVAMIPLVLTACGKVNLNDVAKTAARNYFVNHENYQNFADTTYTLESNSVVTEYINLDYKETADATETKNGTFANVENTNVVYKYYVVNIGEDVAIVIDINATKTDKSYYTDGEGLLKQSTNSAGKHRVYKLSFVEGEGDATYYLTKEVQISENNQVVETTKKYREFSKNDYKSTVGNILKNINKRMVMSGYFEVTSGEMAMIYGSMLSIEGSGSNVKVKLAYDTFDIDDADIIDMILNFEASFKNNNIGEVNIAQTMSLENEYKGDTTLKFYVNFSVADDVNTTISVVGAEEYEYLEVSTDDIPKVEFGFVD